MILVVHPVLIELIRHCHLWGKFPPVLENYLLFVEQPFSKKVGRENEQNECCLRDVWIKTLSSHLGLPLAIASELFANFSLLSLGHMKILNGMRSPFVQPWRTEGKSWRKLLHREQNRRWKSHWQAKMRLHLNLIPLSTVANSIVLEPGPACVFRLMHRGGGMFAPQLALACRHPCTTIFGIHHTSFPHTCLPKCIFLPSLRIC